jgi:hypothetical protein
MSHLKSIFAALVVAVIVGIVPQAYATNTIEVSAAGSSAQWQSLALAAYHVASATTAHTHWSYGSSSAQPIYLLDSRGAINNQDTGTLWVVWNCSGVSCTNPTEAWMFLKVDSVVGVRCLFAQCTIKAPSLTTGTAGQNKIHQYLWGDNSLDSSTVPSWIVSALNTGVPVRTAATDIRPEDAAFAMCRANSTAGSSAAANTPDGLDGLGYNSNWAAGVCPTFGSPASHYVGSPILSGMPGAATSDGANVIAFNISGTDPITNAALPSTFTVVNVGAAPIVFVTARQSVTGLKTVTDATQGQLQQVFSGANCDATAFGVVGGTGLNIFLREPTSGTMNTTEATVFRHPTISAGHATLGFSQETGVGTNNPLGEANVGACTSGSNGIRYRGIGTGEVVAGVQYSNTTSGCAFTSNSTNCTAHPQDGIAYTFFSYGNVAPLADNTKYAYLTLNGVDPIFNTYGSGFDAGQPTAFAGEVPGQTDLTGVTHCDATNGFPCEENAIWTGGLSFPNVRSGAYSAWSLLRAVTWTSGPDSQLTALNALVAAGQTNVVDAVPDYIPYKAVTCTSATHPFGCTPSVADPGLLVLRSHYQQLDGANTILAQPINAGSAVENFTKTGTGAFTESGGDMGGTVFTCAAQTSCPNAAANSGTTHYIPQSKQVVGGFGTGNSTTAGFSGGFTIRANPF